MAKIEDIECGICTTSLTCARGGSVTCPECGALNELDHAGNQTTTLDTGGDAFIGGAISGANVVTLGDDITVIQNSGSTHVSFRNGGDDQGMDDFRASMQEFGRQMRQMGEDLRQSFRSARQSGDMRMRQTTSISGSGDESTDVSVTTQLVNGIPVKIKVNDGKIRIRWIHHRFDYDGSVVVIDGKAFGRHTLSFESSMNVGKRMFITLGPKSLIIELDGSFQFV